MPEERKNFRFERVRCFGVEMDEDVAPGRREPVCYGVRMVEMLARKGEHPVPAEGRVVGLNVAKLGLVPETTDAEQMAKFAEKKGFRAVSFARQDAFAPMLRDVPSGAANDFAADEDLAKYMKERDEAIARALDNLSEESVVRRRAPEHAGDSVGSEEARRGAPSAEDLFPKPRTHDLIIDVAKLPGRMHDVLGQTAEQGSRIAVRVAEKLPSVLARQGEVVMQLPERLEEMRKFIQRTIDERWR